MNSIQRADVTLLHDLRMTKLHFARHRLKLDWRGFLVAAGASVMATSFSELPAVLVQQETGA
jgi:hypothetical protein